MLTKKHFEAIANMIQNNTCVQIIQKHPAHYLLKDTFVKQLADYLEEENPLFDREKFYKACLYDKFFAVT